MTKLIAIKLGGFSYGLSAEEKHPDQPEGCESKGEENGEKNQRSVFHTLAASDLYALKNPVGKHIKNDGSKGIPDHFHKCSFLEAPGGTKRAAGHQILNIYYALINVVAQLYGC